MQLATYTIIYHSIDKISRQADYIDNYSWANVTTLYQWIREVNSIKDEHFFLLKMRLVYLWKRENKQKVHN